MPLYIKDETTTRLVSELARRRGLTKQGAVRLAVEYKSAAVRGAMPRSERANVYRRELRVPSNGHYAGQPAIAVPPSGFDEAHGFAFRPSLPSRGGSEIPNTH